MNYPILCLVTESVVDGAKYAVNHLAVGEIVTQKYQDKHQTYCLGTLQRSVQQLLN